jgi:hypothetical protein
MIFYGTNGTHLRSEMLPGLACSACATPNSLRASLFGRYVHLYWVPFLPYAKLAAVQCGACQATWENQALPPAVAPAVRTLKQQTPQPYWSWAGLTLVAGLAAFGALHSIRETHTDEALLLRPRAGDIYTVRSDNAHLYSLLKVRQASGNAVELLANEYQTANSSPINSLNTPDKYSKEPVTITRLDLQIMRRKGELIDVDRP